MPLILSRRAWAASRRTHPAGNPLPSLRVPPAPRRAPRDVYLYFDNDAKVRAPVDAQSLARKVAALRRDRAA